MMDIYVYKEGMSLEEQKDGAYWERSMLAVYMGIYANKAWNQLREVQRESGHIVDNRPAPCGWYLDTDNNWGGWHRVVSLFDGKAGFHVPDNFDLGDLPEIEPNWNGHTTQDKWERIRQLCGMRGANTYDTK